MSNDYLIRRTENGITMATSAECPKCGTKQGDLHWSRHSGIEDFYLICSWESCPFCGGCLCLYDCNCQYDEMEEYMGISMREIEEKYPHLYSEDLPEEITKKWYEYLNSRRIPFNGLAPGQVEAALHGFWTKCIPGKGWQPCSENDPEAQPDVTTLQKYAHWDRDKKRFILDTVFQDALSIVKDL